MAVLPEAPGIWGSDAFKNIVGLGTLILSATTAWFAYQAGQDAAEAATKAEAARAAAAELRLGLDRNAYSSSLTHQSLPFFEKMRSDDPGVQLTACHIVVALGQVQAETSPRPDIRDLLDTMKIARVFGDRQLCFQEGETVEIAQRVAAEEEAILADDPSVADARARAVETVQAEIVEVAETVQQSISPASEPVPEIGRVHAVMASYQLQNCSLAQSAARAFQTRFADALADGNDDVGFGTQRDVSIYRTTVSNHYAVVIDLGDDDAAASAWARWLRAEGVSADDRVKTGRGDSIDRQHLRYLVGAFVQENRGWVVDPECLANGQ